MDKNAYLSDLNVHPKYLGNPGLLSPFCQFDASARMAMVGNHYPQFVVTDDAEPPRWPTGYESKFGEFEFTSEPRNSDGHIIAVIPKFVSGDSDFRRHNPCQTVIYLDDNDVVQYFDVKTYTALSKGFGYINKMLNQHELTPDTYIDRDMKFATSPNHNGGSWSLMSNVNTVYMPLPGTEEDSVVVSRSLTKQKTFTKIQTCKLLCSEDQIPCPIYGDSTNGWKFFPDIGEQVREDGILAAFRTVDKNSSFADLTYEELRNPQILFDDCILAEAGSTVLDVEIFTAHGVFPKIKEQDMWSQAVFYQQQYYDYYHKIIDIYHDLEREGKKISPAFNTLVTNCKMFQLQRGRSGPKLLNKKAPIKFVMITITYMSKGLIFNGNKLTDNHGNKGVIGAVWEDEDMPTTSDGVRADLVISMDPPSNRGNYGQLYETGLSFAADEVMRNFILPAPTNKERYDIIMDFIHEIRPNEAHRIEDKLDQMSRTMPQVRDIFVEEFMARGKLGATIQPYCKTIGPELMLRLMNKYSLQRKPITYYIKDKKGRRRKYVSKCYNIIGEKLVGLLYKIPEVELSVVAYGYVNQFHLPMKPKSSEITNKHATRITPQRGGEDETANMAMVAGPIATARLYALNANSPVGGRLVQQTLLTSEHPTRIMRFPISTRELLESSANIGIAKHMLVAAGYEVLMEEEYQERYGERDRLWEKELLNEEDH